MQTIFKRAAFLVNRAPISAPCNVRYFSEVLKDQRKAPEKIYFDKEERKAMKRLLQKLDKQAHLDLYKTEEDRKIETHYLHSIFTRHSVSVPSALVDEIIDWKRN